MGEPYYEKISINVCKKKKNFLESNFMKHKIQFSSVCSLSKFVILAQTIPLIHIVTVMTRYKHRNKPSFLSLLRHPVKTHRQK